MKEKEEANNVFLESLLLSKGKLLASLLCLSL